MARRPTKTMQVAKLYDGQCFQMFENQSDPATESWRTRKPIWTRSAGNVIRNPGGLRFSIAGNEQMLVRQTSCRRRSNR